MRLAVTVLFFNAVVWGADPPGVKPPASATDYRAHAEQDHFAIGANLLTSDQVRSGFSSDLNRAYLVVEVAVYPKRDLKIHTADFALRVAGSRDLLRPIGARTVAAVLQKAAQPRGSDIDVYPTVGVGYETGRGYDPISGRRAGGWTTSAGVGVGVGGSGSGAPASTDQDRRTMETELSEKGLPEGETAKPVAGYLYFVSPKNRNVTFDLEYRPGSDRALLPLVVTK